MNISRDGQAGEGRKGSMKEREGKEGVNMKQGLDFDSSALRGGPSKGSCALSFPEPGDEGSIIPIELARGLHCSWALPCTAHKAKHICLKCPSSLFGKKIFLISFYLFSLIFGSFLCSRGTAQN